MYIVVSTKFMVRFEWLKVNLIVGWILFKKLKNVSSCLSEPFQIRKISSRNLR